MIIGFLCIANLNSTPVDVSFADSAFIKAEEYNEMQEIYAPIELDDLEFLKSIFDGRAWKETPSCPCNGVELIFRSKDKEIIIYPAGDGCPTMRIERNNVNYYFNLTDHENESLKKILEGYGVLYPFGI